ncbi:hypothetical protein ACFTXJ_15660 [Streptomyces zhihengii]|uniref:hypothetical protein n=1 Tax=Streptomyces zhihengii TaxID=1818004 RepID=UPI003625A264
MQHDDTEDARTVLLVRHAMDTASADLPPLPDLAGRATDEGRRRRGRRRLALGTAALAVMVAGAAGAVLLPGGTGAPAAVAPAAAPSPAPEPVHIEPTPGEETMADLPADELSRRVAFQDEAVGVLQELLPPGTGTVRRTDLNVARYQVDRGGSAFVLIFSVRPSTRSQATPVCAEAKGAVCATAVLPDGVKARAVTEPVGSGEVTATEVTFTYGRSEVTLSLSPDESTGVSAPVTNEQLLAVASDPAFRELLRYADERPMEPLATSVRGG